MKTEERIYLVAVSHHGIYIPQYFCEQYRGMLEENVNKGNISADDLETVLYGPDHEFYWDSWQNIIDSATFELIDGTYRLINDEDLFLVHIEDTDLFFDYL